MHWSAVLLTFFRCWHCLGASLAMLRIHLSHVGEAIKEYISQKLKFRSHKATGLVVGLSGDNSILYND